MSALFRSVYAVPSRSIGTLHKISTSGSVKQTLHRIIIILNVRKVVAVNISCFPRGINRRLHTCKIHSSSIAVDKTKELSNTKETYSCWPAQIR